jgi:hypothetical protein
MWLPSSSLLLGHRSRGGRRRLHRRHLRRKTLGKIWGLATLDRHGHRSLPGIVHRRWLKDVSGSYTYSIYYALGSFVVAILLAFSLPLKAEPKN